MSVVRIIQLLCPQRHCILGLTYESEDGAADAMLTAGVLDAFAAGVKHHIFNPWCELCHSRDFRTEDRRTIYATLAEAKPHIDKLEREQALTREFIKASKG